MVINALLSGAAYAQTAPSADPNKPTAQGLDVLGLSAETPARAPTIDDLSEVIIEAPEPVYVAPTLRDRIGRIWAPVTINGKGPFRLVLDTGASRSAVTPAVSERLGVEATSPTALLVHGVTGSAVVPAVKVDKMEVGELLIEPSILPVVADAFGGAEGVLGREGLSDKRIFADFLHDKLIISRSHGERAKSGFTTVPLKLVKGGLLMADISIGGVRTRAIIDTGGQQSVGNMALRNALMRHPPLDATQEDIIGVTLEPQRGTTVRVAPIVLGTLKVHNAHVTFSDLFLFEHWNYRDEPTMLIGMDVLGLFDTLIIDYKLHELQIRPRSDGGLQGLQMRLDPPMDQGPRSRF